MSGVYLQVLYRDIYRDPLWLSHFPVHTGKLRGLSWDDVLVGAMRISYILFEDDRRDDMGIHMNYNLNSLKRGHIGYYTGEHYKVY